MANIKKNEVELQLDRVYIASLINQMGRDLNRRLIWEMVNRNRYDRYRKAAIEAGKSEAEAEQIARRSCVTVVSVNREIRELMQRAQQAGMVGAAVFLDGQLADVMDEIEATHLMDVEIWEDLRRSRGEGWTRTRGTKPKDQPGGAIVPTEIVRHRKTVKMDGEADERQEGAAQAALYARLQENSRQRRALRQEALRLRGLAQYVPAAEPDDDDGRTLTQIIMDIDDPEAARRAALKMLQREVDEIQSAAALPFTAEMVALEKLRIQESERKTRLLLDYVKLPSELVQPGGAKSFEIVYELATPKRLNPAPEEEG